MADIHWDPFGTPDCEELLTAPPPEVQTDANDAPALTRLNRADFEEVTQRILERLDQRTPWCEIPAMEPDTMCSNITCTFDDWRHHDVKLEMGRGIVYIIYNRPNENNSMQDTLTHGNGDALLNLCARPDIRVAVFTGEGRMFCAGGDPKAWQAQAAAANSGHYTGDGTVGVRIQAAPQPYEVQMHLQELGMRALKAGAFPDGRVDHSRIGAAKSMNMFTVLPQFTIALVNGSAMGGGVGWVCSCDYVVAVRRAYLVLSEVKIGVIPATISPYVIAKLGVSNSKRFFCAADNIPATKAMEYGMVNEVVENMKEGHEKVRGLCKLISRCGARAVTISKRLCISLAGQPINDALMNYTVKKQADALSSEDGQRGLEAYRKGEDVDWGEVGFDVWPTVGEQVPGGKKKKEKAAEE